MDSAERNEKEVSGRGSGKLLLFGEHAAVHGHPALGVSLPWKTHVSVRPAGGAVWILDGIAPGDAPALEAILVRVEEFVPGFAPSACGRIRIDSDVPRGVGFGSSAALCVAVADAADRLARPGAAEPPPRERWARSHELEKLFHGTPSGIDTGLALLGGLRAFQPASPALPAERALRGFPLHLVVGAVPRSADTKTLVLGLGERVRRGEREVTDRLAKLGAISRRAIDFLDGARPGGPDALGALARDAQRVLAALGLTTPDLDRVLAAGAAAVAAGGKLSGAGGGGAFFLFARDESTARTVAEAVRAAAPHAAGPVMSAVWTGAAVRLLEG